MKILYFAGFVVAAFAKPALENNPMINEGLFEGDILGIDPSDNRNAVVEESRLWPGGVIPYVISPEKEDARDIILKAMRHIEDKSCLRFVQRTTEKDYINIVKRGGCYSRWGRAGGEQPVSLGYDCDVFAIIVHELFHAIGFEHEHNRSDRDEYLTIHWENILKGWEYAFQKIKSYENRLLTKFDFSSVMLYGSLAFSKDNIAYTMTTKDGKFIPDIVDKESMSALDVTRLRMLYKC